MSGNTMLPPESEVLFKSRELTIEQMKALFFDDKSLLAQPEPVYKFTHPSESFYYTFDPIKMRPEYFMPVTGFLKKVMPTPQPIIDNMVDMGKLAFNAKMNERGLYGTMMDIEFNKRLIAGSYDLDLIDDVVREHHKASGSLVPVEFWIAEFNTDITALNQWIDDYEVEPLAIGLMLVSRQLEIGGKIDLACKMNKNLYTDKTPVSSRQRVKRLVDFKSGKKGFYDSHILQLESYRECWDEKFHDYPMDGIANFAPTNWRNEPGYNFKDHTDNAVTRKLPHYIELARIDGMEPKKEVKLFFGTLEKGKPVMGNNCKVVPVAELIVEQMLKRI